MGMKAAVLVIDGAREPDVEDIGFEGFVDRESEFEIRAARGMNLRRNHLRWRLLCKACERAEKRQECGEFDHSDGTHSG